MHDSMFLYCFAFLPRNINTAFQRHVPRLVQTLFLFVENTTLPEIFICRE